MVFAIPGHIYSEHHQGCHQLIREGAILVDHPEQIIEDLALPTQWQTQQQRVENQRNSTSTTQPAYAPDRTLPDTGLGWTRPRPTCPALFSIDC